jgi:hypothetical protein
MREPDWDWEEVLAKPAFWGSYYELFLHEDEEGLWGDDGDDDNDDRDDGGDVDDAGPRRTAKSVFGAGAREIRDFHDELHNHKASLYEFLRERIAESGGDLEAAVEKSLAGDPFAESIPGYRARFRADFEAALRPLPRNKELVLPLGRGFAFVIVFVPGATVYYLDDEGTRVLLGDLSGHQSVPALRWDEIFAIERITAQTLEGTTLPRYVGLLLYATALTAIDDDFAAVRSRVCDGVLRAGVVREEAFEAFIDVLARPAAMSNCEPESAPGFPPGFAWWQEEPYGWVNNSPYGARNPRSFFCRDLVAVDGFARLARWVATL